MPTVVLLRRSEQPAVVAWAVARLARSTSFAAELRRHAAPAVSGAA